MQYSRLFMVAWLGLAALSTPASAQEVKYVTGGIGLAEREHLAAVEKDYNLKVEMATTGGFYVANAHVIIWDKDGNMALEATADGPLLLAALPAGAYSVNIIYQDKEQKKSVTLDGKTPKKLVFVWEGTER